MINEKIQNNYPLKDFSTFKIGGPAEYFVIVENDAEVEEAWAWAKEHNLTVTVLGGGSNMLISDAGVKGLVVKLEHLNLEVEKNVISCGASVKAWDTAAAAYEAGLSGIEWSVGIPGSIGGAIRGNAGAHGGSFDKVVLSVKVFDTEKCEWKTFENADCQFAYRQSRFKLEPHYIIWEIKLALIPGDKAVIKEAMDGYVQYRVECQPKEPSAGCIFKNLFIKDIEIANPSLAKEIEAAGKVRGGKIGAGYLVERLGLKGLKLGGAMVSNMHANFIVNSDAASANDVRMLADKIKRDIQAEFNIRLEEEVQYIGSF